MRPALPLLLAVNGGFVDTAGFLALQGLFTAHVTGNFVTLGAALVGSGGLGGGGGAWAKLLALPVFCCVVALSRLLGRGLERAGVSPLRPLLGVKLLLLTLGAILAVRLGPFPGGGGVGWAAQWGGVLTGMTLVAAMAVQNGAHRAHLGSAPPSTLMTGTTTQIMIDLADLPHTPPAERAAVKARLGRMALSVAAFAVGCGSGAALYALAGCWCFALPPLLGLVILVLA